MLFSSAAKAGANELVQKKTKRWIRVQYWWSGNRTSTAWQVYELGNGVWNICNHCTIKLFKHSAYGQQSRLCLCVADKIGETYRTFFRFLNREDRYTVFVTRWEYMLVEHYLASTSFAKGVSGLLHLIFGQAVSFIGQFTHIPHTLKQMVFHSVILEWVNVCA